MARKGWFTFGREELPASPPGERDTTEDTYNYVKMGERNRESHLEMTVEHKPPVNQYAYLDQAHGSMHQQAAADLARPDPVTGTPKLFGMSSYPGVSKVHYLSGTKEARVHAPTMLGIAQNRTQRDYGRSLQPSMNLSEHSHKLISHLAAKGVTREPEMVSNDLSFQPKGFALYPGEGGAEVPHDEERKGRRTVRRLLAGGQFS